jgi:hypothetical protein
MKRISAIAIAIVNVNVGGGGQTNDRVQARMN